MSDASREARGTTPARRSLGEGGFDRAIDGAVREMLDVEPPANLRARVIAQLPAFAEATAGKPAAGSRLPASGFLSTLVASGFKFSTLVASGFSRNRVVLAAAAAAMILLAVFIARRAPVEPQPPIVAHRGDQRLPVPESAASAPAPLPATRTGAARLPRAPRQAAPPNRVVAAAVAEDTNFTAITALPAPASIEVARLQPPAGAALPSFAPEPMTIRALELTALPETPRQRREE